jgi:hypothetical protein
VGEYNATTGTAVSSFSTINTGLDYPEALAISGNDLYVSNEGSGTVGEYNATTGMAIAADLITGLDAPGGIAISGSDLYVETGGTVVEYNATTRDTVAGFASFTGSNAFALAISPVPEPGTWALVVSCFGFLGGIHGFRRARHS